MANKPDQPADSDKHDSKPDDAADIVATIVPSIETIGRNAWDSLANPTDSDSPNPFSKYDFLHALEQSECVSSLTGWQPQHIYLTKNDQAFAAMPLYLKSHSQGEYVFDHGWAEAFENAGGNYYPKLQCSIPFTPATSPKLLCINDDIGGKNLLLDVVGNFAKSNNISSVHATFLTEKEAQTAAEKEWLIRHDTQFHWENQEFSDFDAFLGTLAARKRKAIRKERRAIAESDIEIDWKTGDEITEVDWDNFYEFYQDTGARKWGRPYLNREFFSLVSESMSEQIVLMIAARNGVAIAGTLNFLGDNTLFGRYWGCNDHVPFLHFELCYYQAIDFAIKHRLSRVEAGAQGEHKLARGYAPNTTRSAHWIGHSGLRGAIADYLQRERKAVEKNQEILGKYAPFKKG